MIIMVTGVAGQLGYDVATELHNRGIYTIGADVRTNIDVTTQVGINEFVHLDITNKCDVEDIVLKIKPDAIIHCAAWTNVDDAEDRKNRALVKRINVEGTDNLVKAAKKINAKFLYISTDYVFDGHGTTPWKPDDKNFSPLNYYGQTKLQGEISVSSQLERFFIVRIAWVFGKNGNNFIKTMLSLERKGFKRVNVVCDQIGTPTYTFDLSKLLVDIVLSDKYGFYHATNEGGFISWADFAEEIFNQSHKKMLVNRVTTSEYGLSVAKRPFNSRLDKTKLLENGFKPLPDWRDAIYRYLKEIGETNEE